MRHNTYAHLVKELRLVKPQDAGFSRKLNELISINELLTTLNEAKTLAERLDIILLTVLGQYGCLKGCMYVKSKETWTIGMAKGMRSCDIPPEELPPDSQWDDLPAIVREPGDDPFLARMFEEGDFEVLLPVRSDGKLVGLLCLSKSMLGKVAEHKLDLLSIIADFGGVIISNSIYHDDLEEMNKQLQRQIFRLNTLYELTGAFSRCYEDDAVFQILANNLMGQFFISRCAVISYAAQPRVIFRKGLKLDSDCLERADDCHGLDSWPRTVTPQAEVACPSTTGFMKQHRLRYALPIANESNVFYLLLLGDRLDRKLLSSDDLDFIISLAEQSASALENVRLQKAMLEKKRMEKELQLARDIQQKLIPKKVPSVNGYELAAEMRPYYQVGGDFYDFIALDDGRLVICLADVSGKSLPASMIMSTAQASLRALNSFSGLCPKDVIERLNKHMYLSTASNKFITMFYAVLDPETHCMRYINCGHNHPILVVPDTEPELLGTGGMVLGMFPRAQYRVGEVLFRPGTELLIYTDGLSEVTTQEGEEYGDDRLIQCLIRKQGYGTLQEEKDEIVKEVMHFSGNEMVDDMTLLMLRRKRDE